MAPRRKHQKNQKDGNKVQEPSRSDESVAEKSSKVTEARKPLPKSQSLDKKPLKGKMESLKKKPTGSPAMKKPIKFIDLTADNDKPSSEKPCCSKNLKPVEMETKKSRSIVKSSEDLCGRGHFMAARRARFLISTRKHSHILNELD